MYLRHFVQTWLQFGPVGFETNHTTREKQYLCQMMIMLCQWD
jgi:hypothetical protein